ncbi:MAG: 8-oxoguanine DNA glycosylase [Verrucomicrobia bacterium]|nr:8-oxoguanine DNA glycosylase [Verrucomicrobiota bacterium]
MKLTPGKGSGSALHGCSWRVEHYNLDATLGSGQVFRWRWLGREWEGAIGGCPVRLRREGDRLLARWIGPAAFRRTLACYLRLQEDMEAILAEFPKDPPIQEAARACRGLRLLRQDPWECLASFLLSSNKQIPQIRRIIECLCRRLGRELPRFPGSNPLFSFPEPEAVAATSLETLRACGMGYRAPFLREAARAVSEGRIDWERLRRASIEEARARLQILPGVGPKIAECVLLYSLGFDQACPVDVWIRRAVAEAYFPGGNPSAKRIREFCARRFGPRAGFVQQCLYEYVRRRNAPVQLNA